MFQRLELLPSGSGRRNSTEGRGKDSRALLQELESQSGVRLDMLVRNTTRFLSEELVQLLLERSHSLRYEDRPQMLRLARLAVGIAERLPFEDPAEERRLSDLCAACYSQLSHALRVSGDFAAAEGAISSAQAFLYRGTGNPKALALVCECLGSLRMAQLRCQEALDPYTVAVEIYRDLGRPDSLGRALVGQAVAVGESGEPEEALAILSEAIPKVEGDPLLTLAACHAVVRLFIDSGKIDQAACHWIDLRDLYDKLNEPMLKIRAAWLEGLLLKAQGRYPAALKLLESARAGFHQRGLSYEAGLVMLDTAECHLRLGRTQKLRQVLSEVVTLVGEHDVDRQALVALISLQRATGDGPEFLRPD